MDMTIVAVGSLDETADLPFTTELYIDRKPEAYSFSQETKKMTKDEVEAMFAGIEV